MGWLEPDSFTRSASSNKCRLMTVIMLSASRRSLFGCNNPYTHDHTLTSYRLSIVPNIRMMDERTAFRHILNCGHHATAPYRHSTNRHNEQTTISANTTTSRLTIAVERLLTWGDDNERRSSRASSDCAPTTATMPSSSSKTATAGRNAHATNVAIDSLPIVQTRRNESHL